MACRLLCTLAACVLTSGAVASTGIHTTYLWHMSSPSTGRTRAPGHRGFRRQLARSITLGHGQSDIFAIFDSDDRAGDYQWHPRCGLGQGLHLGALDFYLGAENDNGWTGWFDAGEAAQHGFEFAKAQGTVLEEKLDLAALYPG